MKKAIALIVAVLFVFAVASISFAVEEKKAAPAPAPAEKKAEPAKKAPKVTQVTGEVKAVDAAAKTITVVKKVKDKAVETVVAVDDKTKITCGKEKKTLADVKAGDKVTVKYTEVDGKNVAKSVAIKPAAPAPEKKKAEPAEKK